MSEQETSFEEIREKSKSELAQATGESEAFIRRLYEIADDVNHINAQLASDALAAMERIKKGDMDGDERQIIERAARYR